MPAVDPDRLAARVRTLAPAFAAAAPYPHVVVDDFLDPAVASRAAAEFAHPDLPWKHYHHVNEKKRVASELDRLGPTCRAVIEALHAPPFLAALASLTGVPGLVGDPELDGAGLHETLAGGFLNVHADHLAHAKRTTWSRRVNLLLFLNADWRNEWAGQLELWDAGAQRCAQRIAPVLNRCVIFSTTPTSFHGVPEGVACPAGTSRKSIAVYYFRDEGQPCRLQPTRYVPRPGDSPTRRLLIRADGALVWAYSALKRYTPLADRAVARLLRYF